MAIVTLCPQCQTAFAIQAEHYSAADAWVRCGRCAHVFEVDQHLYELDDHKTALAKNEESQAIRLPSPPKASSNPMDMTLVWSAMVCLLTLVLCFQLFLAQRHQLRAQFPEIAPVFMAICRHLGCDLNWPLDPTKVSFETGGLKTLGHNEFMFSGSIKNQSDWPLTTPALELTLTDDLEAAVVRKVFYPQDLGLMSVLKGRRSQSFELRFTTDNSVSTGINGYRAFLFYP